jgi:hypothetical protein
MTNLKEAIKEFNLVVNEIKGETKTPERDVFEMVFEGKSFLKETQTPILDKITRVCQSFGFKDVLKSDEEYLNEDIEDFLKKWGKVFSKDDCRLAFDIYHHPKILKFKKHRDVFYRKFKN